MRRPITTSDRVYSPADNGLGDHWAAVNWCLHQSIASGAQVLLSDRPVMEWHSDKFRSGRLADILSLLWYPAGCVQVVKDCASDRVEAEEIWQVPYFPTRVEWRPNRSRRVCYQPDPVTMAANAMNEADESTFVEAIRQRGYEPCRLTGEIPLARCVEILAGCEALICTSSGFAHVAHSVGTPVFLVQGAVELGYLIKHHVGKAYVLCQNYEDSLNWLHQGVTKHGWSGRSAYG